MKKKQITGTSVKMMFVVYYSLFWTVSALKWNSFNLQINNNSIVLTCSVLSPFYLRLLQFIDLSSINSLINVRTL